MELVALTVAALLAVWVYRDANARKDPHPVAWAIGTLLLAFIVLPIWLLKRPPKRSEATRRCPHCAEEIQAAAVVCRFCDRAVEALAPELSPVRGTATAFKWVLGVVGAVVLLAVIGAFVKPSSQGDAKPPASETLQRYDAKYGVTDAAARAAAIEQGHVISATDLYAEYDANEIAAEQKFKGQRVTVTGIIDDIGTDVLSTPYVTLGNQNGGIWSVQAMFGRNQDEGLLARLSKGQQVRVRCDVSGKLGNIILRGCSIP